jgi:hypothetical protein
MDTWMPMACGRRHSMSEWENLPAERCLGPPIAKAQCNEGSMERQPVSDITARLSQQRIHARDLLIRGSTLPPMWPKMEPLTGLEDNFFLKRS